MENQNLNCNQEKENIQQKKDYSGYVTTIITLFPFLLLNLSTWPFLPAFFKEKASEPGSGADILAVFMLIEILFIGTIILIFSKIAIQSDKKNRELFPSTKIQDIFKFINYFEIITTILLFVAFLFALLFALIIA